MVVRKKRKITKLRGSRTCAGGHVKKRRGAGNRGGRGRAGLMKHKKSLWTKMHPKSSNANKSLHKRVGRRFGFKLPQKINRVKEINTIRLRDLDILVNRLGLSEIDLSEFGYQKVLSGGKLTKKVSIKAEKFSKKAREDIEKFGSSIIEG